MSEWRPAKEARVDGVLCDLRFRDCLGPYEVVGDHFLHDDGHWYRINPPTRVSAHPTHYRQRTP